MTIGILLQQKPLVLMKLLPPSTFGKSRLIADDNVSEISTEESIASPEEFQLNQFISDENLKMLIEEQSLNPEPLKKGISNDEELRYLRRKIQESIHPPPAEITAKKLLFGKKCSLEPYKALEEKVALLDEVIATGNGGAILGVVIFLEKTLNKKQFNKILMTRSDAANHYLNYLESKMKIYEATDILSMLGRDLDAAMLQFKIAVKMYSDPQIQRQKLKRVYCDYFTQPGTNPHIAQFVSNAINLLEWQLLEKTKGTPESSDLVGKTPVETLYYACSKHNWKDSHSSDSTNPFKFINDFKISRSLFEWTALNERGKSKAYPDLEKIFEKSSWTSLIAKPFQINIPLDLAIMRLADLEAPSPVLQNFLAKVNDSNDRLELAQAIKCSKGIIDALAALKDKEELQKYINSLPEGSEERFYGENTLKSVGKKWPIESLPLMKK
ncbi:vacuolar protein sorting-associated protein 16B isoform X2 [Condylostylus longicornis]|uniref:vacuolar protein sorting-associated protein 16B isoform X2 n=1 Tax=Condylostylus longicornis TaxID=2530218 RepID=UPI00244E15B5|nr:vacuolar protein sorting-associated protein 16B isoform X2 [Condylostylus longicornis]